MNIMKEVGVGLEKGHIQITSEGMTEVIVIVGQGQDQEQVPKETERETDQIQQMFKLDEEPTSLKMLATDTYDSFN